MNYTAFIITVACTGVAAVTALAFWAWDATNTRRINRLLAQADAPRIVDCEDHGHEPTDIEQQIIDNLRATPLEITPEMRDRAIARHAEQFPADAAYRGIVTAAPTPPAAPADLGDLLAEVRRVWDLAAPQPAGDGDGVFTADELEQQVADYEAAAADRFRHAGVTWPTNPATVGIARYGDKAGKA